MAIKKSLVAMTVALASISVPPLASAYSSECGNNLVCLFDDANFGRLLGSRAPGIGLMNVSHYANDKTSSWINNTWTDAAWYKDANGQGVCSTMTRKPLENYVGFWSNDRLSSWRTDHGC